MKRYSYDKLIETYCKRTGVYERQGCVEFAYAYFIARPFDLVRLVEGNQISASKSSSVLKNLKNPA